MGGKLRSLRLATGGLVAGGLLGMMAVGSAAGSGGIVVNTTEDSRYCEHGGACSLRGAILKANADGGETMITLQAGATYHLGIAGAGEDYGKTGDLDISSNVHIIGNGATVNANGIDRAFDVIAGAYLNLEGVTVVNGAPPSGESGGAVRSVGALTVSHSYLAWNKVDGMGASGGAIVNNGGTATVSGSTLAHNSAARAGGAIEAVDGYTVVERSHLLSNYTGPTPGNGGGLHLTGAGRVEVTNSYVRDNVATAEGGGLWNSASGTMVVSGTTLTGNVAHGADADQGGGGLFNDGGGLHVMGSTITGNHANGASGSGGGILNNKGTLDVSGTTIAYNAAMRAGGGVEANAGTTKLTTTSLVGNETGPAPGNGGGFHLTGAGVVTIDRGAVIGNTATAEGGGLWNSAGGRMTVTATTIQNNVASGAMADQGGGGIFNDGGALTVADSTLAGNVANGASGSGGGLFNNDGNVRVDNTRFDGNTAKRAGGGVEALKGNTMLSGVSLVNNSTGAAPGNGGGVHLTGAGTVEIHGSNVRGNSASNEGGGLWNSATGKMLVSHTTVEGNRAPVGPDVFNDGGSFILDGMAVQIG